MADRLALAFALILNAHGRRGAALRRRRRRRPEPLSVPGCPEPVLPAAGLGDLRRKALAAPGHYLRSYREDEGHGNYPLDDVDASVQRANIRTESQHYASVLVSWRALGRSRDDSSLSILFGGAYMHGKQADCFASEGPVVRIPTPADWPPDSVVFRQELTPEERSRCTDYTRTYQHIFPQAGAVLDLPVGERLFFRASARMFQVEVGVGVKF